MRAVRFRMHALAVTYPMGDNTTAPADESRTRESVHAAQAQQLERQRPSNWTPVDLVRLYEDACRSREEMPLQRIRTALLGLGSKEIDLTGLQLNLGSAEAVSDVLSVDFGLKKLILDSCGLDDDVRFIIPSSSDPCLADRYACRASKSFFTVCLSLAACPP